MNKYQEAWKRIKHTTIYDVRVFDDNDEEIKLIQELVDKETHLNLPLHHGVYMQCKCEAMSEIHSNYCWNCGQALDWSKDD